MEMKTVHIGDLGEIITGSTPSKKNPDNYGDYALWIKPTDINPDEKYTTIVEEMFSEKAAHDCRTRMVPAKSVCVPCIGTVGTKLTMTPCDCFVNQSINAVVPNEDYDNDYVYYLLLNFLPTLKSYNKGTASGREYIAKSAFENIEIKVHSNINIQRRIGEILSAYDDMIAKCKKQIALLEEAAQRIYREWFVDMHFPGYESTPVGENGLPKGWHKSNVNAEMTFQRGFDLPKTKFLNGSVPVVGSTSILGYHSEHRVKGPGIVTGRSGSLGKFQFITDDFWPHNTSLFLKDRGVHSIYFIHQLLLTLDFSKLNSGGAIPSLNRNTLSNIEIACPSRDVENKFDLVIRQYYNLKEAQDKTLKVLLEQKKNILPRLISGEIKIDA